MRTVVSRNEAETERIAARFARTLRGGEVILLTGELGAGKTVFVRGLAHGLGVRGRITSPTFVLMRIYRAHSRKPIAGSRRGGASKLSAFSSRLSALGFLVHVDAYRVRDARELEAIGLSEWIGRPDTVVAIEWGERVYQRLRDCVIRVILTQKTGDQSTRAIRIVCPVVKLRDRALARPKNTRTT
jgi:tRNA threonylcarbamoyladenosine biosynthesis protein TsaE